MVANMASTIRTLAFHPATFVSGSAIELTGHKRFKPKVPVLRCAAIYLLHACTFFAPDVSFANAGSSHGSNVGMSLVRATRFQLN
jgi:hypothetical protein